MTSYKVTVKTADTKFAGTDAKVFIKLFGSCGLELELALTDKRRDLFEQDQIDEFVFRDVPSVGDIKRLKVWHDNTGEYFLNHCLHLFTRHLGII